jgi:transposase
VPADTAALGERLFPPANLYRQIGERFDQLFPNEQVFAPLYDSQGRGAIPPLLVALVTVFQMLEQVPDRQAAEWVVSRLDWKYALHLPLDYAGFHFTDLSAFRARLLSGQQEQLVFEQLLERLKGLGLVHAHSQIRSDSTHLLGVVARLSQLELVAESLRLAVQAVVRADEAWGQAQLPASFRERYGVRLNEFGLSPNQVRERLEQVGQAAFWFLEQLEQAAEPLRHLSEVETLRQVLAQQFPGGSDSPPAAKRPQGREVLESPHEPEARRGTKRAQSWIGYKGQVSETCADGEPHLVVDVDATGALENDSQQLAPIQQRLKRRGLPPAEHFIDQGFMSAALLYRTLQEGLRLMGVPLADTQSAPGFRQADFQIDEAARQATCPAGQRCATWSEHPVAEAPQPQVQLRFPGQACQACAFWGVCTKSPQGRSLTLSPFREVLRQRRAEAQTEEFQEQMHRRAGIEATLSELVRRYRLRRARYRGLAKLRLQAFFTGVAINLARLARWWAALGELAPASG